MAAAAGMRGHIMLCISHTLAPTADSAGQAVDVLTGSLPIHCQDLVAFFVVQATGAAEMPFDSAVFVELTCHYQQ